MGQKVNPIGLRLGINRTWDSRWFADGHEYGKLLHEDVAIRKFLTKELKQAGISRIVIERPHKKCRITLHSARPGVVIGKKGADIERLRRRIAQMTDSDVHLNIVEVRKPELDATLIADNVAQQLERRVAFRRAMKRAVQNAQKAGALGIRVQCSGRLGGSEMARTEWYREGRVPLHTLRADVDYGFREAKTTYGRIGVKVWLYKGDILPYKVQTEDKVTREAAMAVGEATGPSRPKKIVSSAGARKDEETPEEETVEPAPLVAEADPEFEKLLDEEEAIAEATRESHETPHFRPGEAD